MIITQRPQAEVEILREALMLEEERQRVSASVADHAVRGYCKMVRRERLAAGAIRQKLMEKNRRLEERRAV